MFFYLSQFLSFLAMPLTIIIILILVGIVLKRKKILWTGIVLLLFFSNQFIANLAMHQWEPEFKAYEGLPEYEIGILLTGVTNLNKTAYDRTFFNKGADRATHTLQLYKLGKIKKILISGGQGLNPSNTNTEAELLRDFMVMAGVPESDIIVENQAVNTYQNAVLTKETLSQIGYDHKQTHFLITSAFHMMRAKGCFEKAGLNTETFPVDYYSEDVRFSIPKLLAPDPYAIFLWHKLFKEWIGLVVYKVVGYI
jgi:uncharacterized SAM-binding protein YcdF (DUF218 family)